MNPPKPILDQMFERVVILSMDRSSDRLEECTNELVMKNLSLDYRVVKAVDGQKCPAPSWFKAGNSAWGCLLSHHRVVTDALLDGVETLLVLEDDVTWQEEAPKWLEDVRRELPGDWGQLYLGGQHRGSEFRPQQVPGLVSILKARSVHRTHAYAIHRRAMAKFTQHILHAPDFIAAMEKQEPHKMHVDHQLEQAHRRGDWPVYVPSLWMAGQRGGLSTISGKMNRDQWWHYSLNDAHRSMPIVLCTRKPSDEEAKWLHFGNTLDEKDPTIDLGIKEASDASELNRIMVSIAREAYRDQRLPAVNTTPEKVQWLKERWAGRFFHMADLDHMHLRMLCTYSESKMFTHPWVNPIVRSSAMQQAEEATRVPVVLTDDTGKSVHQIWIGDKPMPERLQGYTQMMRTRFPGWKYRFWTEADMPALAKNAVLPSVVDGSLKTNIGLRADVVRLEILRQFGGLYMDADFEPIREDLGRLFVDAPCFVYTDYHQSGPSNSVLYAPEPNDPVVTLYLRRIASHADLSASDRVPVLQATGPFRLGEVVTFFVGSWKNPEPYTVDGVEVGSNYSGGAAIALHPKVFFPYWFDQHTYRDFKPENHPDAWGAHHWEESWTS